jgi:hypothetical protein
MSLKSEIELDREELMFSSELGWFAALAIVVVNVAPLIFH